MKAQLAAVSFLVDGEIKLGNPMTKRRKSQLGYLPWLTNSINKCRIYTNSDMRSGRKMDSVENFRSSWVLATTTARFTMLVLMIFFFF